MNEAEHRVGLILLHLRVKLGIKCEVWQHEKEPEWVKIRLPHCEVSHESEVLLEVLEKGHSRHDTLMHVVWCSRELDFFRSREGTKVQDAAVDRSR